MNAFGIVLKDRTGRVLSPNSYNNDGTILNNELSCWEREVVVVLEPIGPAKLNLDQMARSFNWPEGYIPLDSRLDGSTLMSYGPLPDGIYYLNIRVEDMRVLDFRQKLHLHKGGPLQVTSWVVEDDSEIMKFVSSLSFSEQTQRVILHQSSWLDHMPLMQFLQDQTRRTRRKACLLNLLATLEGFSNPHFPFSSTLQYIYFLDTDRFYGLFSWDLLQILHQNSKFWHDPAGINPKHMRIKSVPPRGVSIYDRQPINYRSKTNPSLQLCCFEANFNQKNCILADVDIDLGYWASPTGFIIHTAECYIPGKTNHYRLYNRFLKNAKLAPLLGYSLQQNAFRYSLQAPSS